MKVLSGMALLALMSVPAAAQSVSQQQLATCAGIQNAIERLVCYDKLAQGQGVEVAAGAAQSTAPQTAKNTEQSTSTSYESEFGKEHRDYAENRPDRLVVSIVSREQDPYGKWIVTLDNGQVWKENDSSSTFRFSDDADYFIERGMLNSFFLGRTGLNTRMRVRRID